MVCWKHKVVINKPWIHSNGVIHNLFPLFLQKLLISAEEKNESIKQKASIFKVKNIESLRRN